MSRTGWGSGTKVPYLRSIVPRRSLQLMLMAMKRHLDLAGKGLAGAGLTGVVLYVVGTATQRSWPFWPYWIFIGMVLIGGLFYFLGQSHPAAEIETAEEPVGTQAGPVLADRWRQAVNGLSTALTQLQHNSMSHPAYMHRDPHKRPPPSVRVGVIIASSELDPENPDTAEVRRRFLSFLSQPEIMDLIRELTDVGTASWQARNENPRFNFGAVLTSGGEDVTPIAWARLLLPERWAPRYGHDSRVTSLVLQVELGGTDGTSAEAASLAIWQQRFARALRLPTALAAFLVDNLDLQTSGDPPAEVALWLEASTSLTELVDIDGLGVVAGSPQLSDFTGYAVAEADGQDRGRLALAWLRIMCDSCLHLDGSATALASLETTGGPPLEVSVSEPEWRVWRHLVYIVAVRVKMTNTTDTRIRLSGMGVGCDWGGATGTVPQVTAADRLEIEREEESLIRHQYSPRLNMHSVVEPHDSVSGWLVTDVPWLGPHAGTPELAITIQEAVGREYRIVIPRQEAETFRSVSE